RRADKQNRKQDQVVENLVANGLAEHVDGDRKRSVHMWSFTTEDAEDRRTTRGNSVHPPWHLHHIGRRHLLDKEILEGFAYRVQRHELCTGRGKLREQPLRRRFERQLELIPRVAN